MKKILGVYHLACMNHYIDVFCEQFDLLHSSGLYTASNKLLIYISKYDDNPILDNKLKEYDPDNKFLIFKSKDNLKEKFAINLFRNHISNESYMFYFHSKGVSRKITSPSQVWRKNLDFYTISKWKISLELLKNYDAVGCFLTRWPVYHFSGNFWWAKIDYIIDLPDCGDHYLAPEMWLGANFNNNFISLSNIHREKNRTHIERTDESILKNITTSIIYNEWFKERPIWQKYYSKINTEKIAIVLHIYHTNLWRYFEEKLKSLDTQFDLYITLCDEVEDISKDILKSFPSANITKYPNKGQDIGPFLKTFKKIRNKDYDYLIKLHTKKCEYNLSLGNNWRDELVNPLISSDRIIRENISTLKQAEYKMCGSKKWFKKNKFIGGTMFMVDFKILSNCLTDELVDEWYAKMPRGYVQKGSFTHRVERLLGKIILDKGYKIKGVSRYTE